MKILGSHNSCTGYKLVGWQKLFAPLLNLFSKCQKKSLEQQFKEGVRLFDLQVNLKDGRWIASHGTTWYDIEPFGVLNELSIRYNEKVYVYLGLDKHFFHPYEIDKFYNMRNQIELSCPNLEIKRVYLEGPYRIVYDDHDFSSKLVAKYWSLTWAKEKAGGKWWKAYFYLPIPILWKKLYKEEWDKFKEDAEYYITDFV